MSNNNSPIRERADQHVQTDGADATTRQAVTGINGTNVDDEARRVAYDYVHYRLIRAGFPQSNWPALAAEPPRYCFSMRMLGDEFERRYDQVFHDMSTTLQITPSTAHQTFVNVCDELFRGNGDDIEVKWGRVVALHAFAGAFAVQCADKEMPQQVRNVPEWLALYTRAHLAQWIESHGGWDGIVQFYENGNGTDKWSSFKKVMTGVGVACGALGVATLAHMLVGRP